MKPKSRISLLRSDIKGDLKQLKSFSIKSDFQVDKEILENPDVISIATFSLLFS